MQLLSLCSLVALLAAQPLDALPGRRPTLVRPSEFIGGLPDPVSYIVGQNTHCGSPGVTYHLSDPRILDHPGPQWDAEAIMAVAAPPGRSVLHALRDDGSVIASLAPNSQCLILEDPVHIARLYWQ